MSGAYLKPAIKWTGSKRYLLGEILPHFKGGEVYHEPFLGGGSVLMGVIQSEVEYERYSASDTNEDLIKYHKQVKGDPQRIISAYRYLWSELQRIKGDEAKKEYYYEVRSRFNESRDVGDFAFLNRTCVNGLIRYNGSGEFNSPFHFGRPGMSPAKLEFILSEWYQALQTVNVSFNVRDFSEVTVGERDESFVDPPYAGTLDVYNSERFDPDRLFRWSAKQRGKVIMTYNGENTARRHEGVDIEVPDGIFEYMRDLPKVSGSLKRVLTNNQTLSTERLYIKN